MEIQCPQCSKKLTANEINVKDNLAHCTQCNAVFKLSDIIENKAQEQPIDLSVLPVDSQIQLTKNSEWDYVITTKRKFFLSAGSLFMLFFSFFWLSFITVWTFFAAQGNVFFALFSIPFWIVGLVMFFFSINGLTEKQSIHISNTAIEIRKERLLFSKQVEILYNDIVKIDNRHKTSFFTNTNKNTNQEFLEQPTIVYNGNQSIRFFGTLSKEDKLWIVAFLKFIVKKKINKDV